MCKLVRMEKGSITNARFTYSEKTVKIKRYILEVQSIVNNFF